MRAVLLILLGLLSTLARAERITACGGENEWPPSSYYDRQQPERVVGYSPDVLRAALKGSDYQLNVILLPWARCLTLAKSGTGVHIVMGATRSPEREAQYGVSQPYLELNPQVYYLADRYPAGARIRERGDMVGVKVCGLLGFNYGYLGLDPAQLDVGATDYPSLIAKLRAGRCEVFVENAEVVSGFRKLLHAALSDPQLRKASLQGLPTLRASFLVSRDLPYAADLLQTLDRGILRLRKQGELKRLLKPHLEAE